MTSDRSGSGLRQQSWLPGLRWLIISGTRDAYPREDCLPEVVTFSREAPSGEIYRIRAVYPGRELDPERGRVGSTSDVSGDVWIQTYPDMTSLNWILRVKVTAPAVTWSSADVVTSLGKSTEKTGSSGRDCLVCHVVCAGARDTGSPVTEDVSPTDTLYQRTSTVSLPYKISTHFVFFPIPSHSGWAHNICSVISPHLN